MNAKSARFYVQALGGFGASGLGAAGVNDMGPNWHHEGSLGIDGLPIFVAKGMSDNVMLITTSENLAYGVGDINDKSVVKVIDMEDIDGSSNVRVVMRLSAGCQILNPEDVVTYGITNGSN
jgi:hypothetical protein